MSQKEIKKHTSKKFSLILLLNILEPTKKETIAKLPGSKNKSKTFFSDCYTNRQIIKKPHFVLQEKKLKLEMTK